MIAMIMNMCHGRYNEKGYFGFFRDSCVTLRILHIAIIRLDRNSDSVFYEFL